MTKWIKPTEVKEETPGEPVKAPVVEVPKRTISNRREILYGQKDKE